MIELLLELFDLKREERAHTRIFNVEEPETVAGHSWGTAFLTALYARKAGVDEEKALKMALIHDLAEAEIGDIPNRHHEEDMEVNQKEKNRLEEQAWEDIGERMENEEIIELWREYEERESKEAVFVKDMDLLELSLQALKNERGDSYSVEEAESPYENLDEIMFNVKGELKTELGRELFRKIRKKYEDAKDE